MPVIGRSFPSRPRIGRAPLAAAPVPPQQIDAIAALDSGSLTTNLTDYTTNSISPTPGRMLVVVVQMAGIAAAVDTVVTGLGGTWTRVGGIKWATSYDLSVHTCVNWTGSGTLNLNNADAATNCLWSVVEVAGADPDTPVVPGSIVTTSPGAVNTASITLNTPAYSGNRPFAAFGNSDNNTAAQATPRAGWTEHADVAIATPSGVLQTQSRVDAWEGTASVDWVGGPYTTAGLAFELAAAQVTTPPTFGAAGSQVEATTATMSVDVPDGVVADSLVVVTAFVDGTATVTGMPSGFAQAPDSPVAVNTGSSGQHRLYVMWKRATGTESTGGTYDFTLSGSTFVNGQAIRYDGALTTGNPWNVTASAQAGATNVTATPAVSDQTTIDQTLLVWAASNWAGPAPPAWTPPAGFTERRDTGTFAQVTVADLVKASAGATGSISGTCTVADKSGAWLGALRGTLAGGAPATNAPATEATGTGTAETPSVAITVTAAEATASAAAQAPTAGVAAVPTEAPATGTAQNPAADLGVNAAPAAATGTAETPAAAVAPDAAAATATGTAFDATVSTSTGTSANAGEAAGTGTAPDPAAAIAANAEAAAGKLGVAVPAYFNPTTQGSVWDALIADHRGVPFIVVSPASGPGGSVDPDYTTRINQARAAGIRVMGYVDTNYGAVPAATADGEIDTWRSFYGIDGIFFDRAPGDTATVAYMTARANKVRATGAASERTVVVNPGWFPADEAHVTLADHAMVFENDYDVLVSTPEAWYPAYLTSGAHDPTKFWWAFYNADTSEMRDVLRRARRWNVGLVYATDDTISPLPYDSLPSYWSTLLDAAYSGTAEAFNATASLGANAGNAAGTGTADTATASVTPNAAEAAGTGTANTATPAITASPAEAAATGTAFDATVSTSGSTNAPAGLAAGTGTAYDASVAITAPASVAAATGEAADAVAGLGAQAASPADAVGEALAPGTAVATNAAEATATGAAFDATVSTSSSTNAPAGEATGTGAALDAVAAVGANAGAAAGTGTADNAAASLGASAAEAAGTGTAPDPSAAIGTPAAEAIGAGAAETPAAGVAPNAGQAAATGQAFDATVSTQNITNAPAGEAAGSGTAFDASVAITFTAGVATGAGQALAAVPEVGALPPAATGGGVAHDAAAAITAPASAATASGAAYNPFASFDLAIIAVGYPVITGDSDRARVTGDTSPAAVTGDRTPAWVG